VIAHPHLLHGGTRDNKVVQSWPALLALGYVCWRPNFRGVGESAANTTKVAANRRPSGAGGLRTARRVPKGCPTPPLSWPDFRSAAGNPASPALARGRATRAPGLRRRPCRVPARGGAADTLVILGETDDVVPLAAVFEWARPLELPVVVIPGADHFFHRKLPLVKRIVMAGFGKHD
jgi:hypothetical protein